MLALLKLDPGFRRDDGLEVVGGKFEVVGDDELEESCHPGESRDPETNRLRINGVLEHSVQVAWIG